MCFFITDKQFENQKYQFGLSCVDIFSKFAAVVPMEERDHDHVMPAILEAFRQMGKQPEILMTDPERALTHKDVKPFFEEASIQHIITQAKPHFVERFHRTFRGMLHKRHEYLTKKKKVGKQPADNFQWHELIPQIMQTYNFKNVHSATGKTPAEARKPSNEIDVKSEMELKAKTGRVYPTIEEGDKVRIIRKKVLGDKEFVGDFRWDTRTVESISENFGQKFYKLSDGREYIRSDIVKI